MSIQIPSLHTSNRSLAKARAKVFIQSRQDSLHSGTFVVSGTLRFNPATQAYPAGTMNIHVDLSDSSKGDFKITTVEQIDIMGKHNPTVFATGRCDGDVEKRVPGYRYWLMLADNKRAGATGTPDVVSFVIYDRNGKRAAYGSGPVAQGDVAVTPNGE